MSWPPFPERIETARLILRPPTLADALSIAEAVNASYAELHERMQWARGPYGIGEAQAYCESARESMAAGREYPVLLTHRDDRRIVGGAGLVNVKWAVPMCEIGYWLRTNDVGRGYCSEATRALTRHAFEELKANRVALTMDDRNSRSWAVAERLGFTWEATHRSDRRDNQGRLSHTRVYAMFDVSQLR